MPAGSEEHDDVVEDVADALTLNQDVQWERCEKLATPADRRALANLRTLARLVTGGEPAPEAAAAAGTRRHVFVRPASQVLVAIAAVEVAAALMLLPWAWGDYRREHGEIAVYLATKLVGHSASACLLLFAGRHDRRTWLLGIYCLLKATQPPLHMLPAFLLELAPPEALAHLEPADRGLGKLRGDTAAVAPLLDRLLRTGADPFGLSIVGREMKRPEDDWRRRKRYPSAAPPP